MTARADRTFEYAANSDNCRRIHESHSFGLVKNTWNINSSNMSNVIKTITYALTSAFQNKSQGTDIEHVFLCFFFCFFFLSQYTSEVTRIENAITDTRTHCDTLGPTRSEGTVIKEKAKNAATHKYKPFALWNAHTATLRRCWKKKSQHNCNAHNIPLCTPHIRRAQCLPKNNECMHWPLFVKGFVRRTDLVRDRIAVD